MCHYKTVEELIMTCPSPVTVIDLTDTITIGVRDWSIAQTLQMYIENADLQEERTGVIQPWAIDTISRLTTVRQFGPTSIAWMPDANDGAWISLEEWFIRYGFAPDMIESDEPVPENDLDNFYSIELNEDDVDLRWFNDDDTEDTCSITINSADV